MNHMNPVVHFEMPAEDGRRMAEFYTTAFGWQTMKKVAGAGGILLGKPADIPGVGKYISFIDTEGNRASMLQPFIQIIFSSLD